MKAAIPAIQTGDESLNRVLEAMKMNLDGITGQTSNSDKLVALDKTATPLKLVNLVNLLAKRLGLDGVTSVQELTNFLSDAAGSVADYKASVRVASTAAINLAAPGATIDGVTMAVGDRFLEKDNATASARGIYIWNGAAVAATRATDADGAGELTSGSIVAVEEGDANGDSLWMLATDGAITIGTTALTWARKDAGAAASSSQVSVRQTVMAGAATRLAIGTGLAVNLLATTTPVRVAFAAGMGVSGNVDYVGTLSADVAGFWSGLTANVINYLFYDRNVTTGAITGVASTLPYISQDSTVAISTVNGQHTYVSDTGQMYVGNGSTATAVQRTAEGECLAGAASITSVTSYAKGASYQGAWTATLPAAGVTVSFNHNIGTIDTIPHLELQCTTADAGYSVGEVLTVMNGNSSGVAVPITFFRTAKYVGFTVPPTSNMLVSNKSGGGNTVMTLASWKYRFVNQRAYK